MIEMLGVLAIVGVLSVGGLVGYTKAMSKYKSNKAINEIQTLVSGVRTLYAGQPAYGTAAANLVPTLLAAGVGNEFAGGTTTILDPYGNSITVQVPGTITDFVITLSYLSIKACIEIATAGWVNGDTSLVNMTVGSTVFTTTPNLTGIIMACGTTDGAARVAWEYK